MREKSKELCPSIIRRFTTREVPILNEKKIRTRIQCRWGCSKPALVCTRVAYKRAKPTGSRPVISNTRGRAQNTHTHARWSFKNSPNHQTGNAAKSFLPRTTINGETESAQRERGSILRSGRVLIKPSLSTPTCMGHICSKRPSRLLLLFSRLEERCHLTSSRRQGRNIRRRGRRRRRSFLVAGGG